MSKPDNFILSTDYATLKNSQRNLTATVTIPGSTVIAGDALAEWHQDVTITAPYAISQAKISSSKNSSRMLIGNAYTVMRTGINGGVPADYSIYAMILRTSSTNVRFQAIIQNPYATPLTGETVDEVFNTSFYTFVPPFS